MEDPATTLETQIELEKMEIPVPEKTLEAAVKRAKAVASKLRASKKATLSAAQVHELSKIASEIKSGISEAGIIPEDNEEAFCAEITEDVYDCANEFDCLGDKCQAAVDEIEEKKVEASEKITRIAQKILSTHREISSAKLNASVKRILSDATKLDLMKNLVNIENKSNKDQTLQTLVDWNKVGTMSSGVGKTTQLKNLKVQDLKNLLVCLRGGRGAKDND